MKAFSGGLRGIHRRGGATYINKGQPPGVAMGQNALSISNQPLSMPANFLAMLHILIREFFGGRQSQSLFFRHSRAGVHFFKHSQHCIDRIDGCWPCLFQRGEDRLHVPFESARIIAAKRERSLRQAVRGSRADRSRAAHGHIPNGGGCLAIILSGHHSELMGEQSLIDQAHLVCGIVKCHSPKRHPLFSKLNEHRLELRQDYFEKPMQELKTIAISRLFSSRVLLNPLP